MDFVNVGNIPFFPDPGTKYDNFRGIKIPASHEGLEERYHVGAPWCLTMLCMVTCVVLDQCVAERALSVHVV